MNARVFRHISLFAAALIGMSAFASAQGALDQMNKEVSELATRVLPGVVAVEAFGGNRASGIYENPGLLENANEMVKSVAPAGPLPPTKGSGFLIDTKGFILTSADLVRGAKRCSVQGNTGRRFDAKLISIDELNATALLKTVELPVDMVPLKFGDSNAVSVGGVVVTVGGIGGYDRSVAFGILAGKGRSVVLNDGATTLSNLLQISGPVGPGSPGSAVVNVHGEVIGIVVASVYPQGDVMNRSSSALATPINDVVSVLQKMREGKLERPFLGVTMVDAPQGYGALIKSVMPDGPAASAGIEPGDVIMSLNTTRVARLSDVASFIRAVKPGDVLDIALTNGNARRKVQLTVGKR